MFDNFSKQNWIVLIIAVFIFTSLVGFSIGYRYMDRPRDKNLTIQYTYLFGLTKGELVKALNKWLDENVDVKIEIKDGEDSSIFYRPDDSLDWHTAPEDGDTLMPNPNTGQWEWQSLEEFLKNNNNFPDGCL